MNVKYYPKLKSYAACAQKVLTAAPEISNVKANKPADILVNVHNVMADTFGKDNKDFSFEVAKMIFYGYYKEVNAYYSK